jgi:ketosteroid isomerase-like protein
MRGGCRYVRTALLSAPVQHVKRDRVFADVEERFRLKPNLPTEGIRDVRVPPSYPLVAVVDGGTGTRHGRVKFDLGIAKRQIGVYVARIERFVQATMELDVLLRHVLRLTGGPGGSLSQSAIRSSPGHADAGSSAFRARTKGGILVAVSKENVEIVRRVYEAAARRDAATVLALYDPEVELDPSRLGVAGLAGGGAAVYRGHDGLRSLFRDWHEVWADMKYDFEELFDAGDEYVISVVTRRARGRASGADVERPFALVWTLRDGKVVRVVWFLNRTDALEAAGVAEQNAAPRS